MTEYMEVEMDENAIENIIESEIKKDCSDDSEQVYNNSSSNNNRSKNDGLSIEQVILAVEKRPILYNSSLKEYSDRDKKSKAWENVLEEIYPNFNEQTEEEKSDLIKDAKTRWKSARDTFVRELHASNSNSDRHRKKRKYVYYDKLLFLKTLVNHPRTPKSSTKEDKNSKSSKHVHIQPKLRTIAPSSTNQMLQPTDKHTTVRLIRPVPDLTEILTKSLNRMEAEARDDSLGNRNFALSLVPFLQQLDKKVNLELRVKIMNEIMAAIDSKCR